jgi:aminomethyltransferase
LFGQAFFRGGKTEMTHEDKLRQSPLHDLHMALEAKMGDEAGHLVPLSYGNALGEVRETRARAGVFDLSHAGRIRLRGDQAQTLLERLCTHDVAHQEDATVAPSLLCNERGGIVSDAQLLRLEDHWLLDTPAGNRAKVLEHLAAHWAGLSVKIDDQTDKSVRIDVLGPRAGTILDALLPFKVSQMAPGAVIEGSMLIVKYVAARTDLGRLWAAQVILPTMLAGKAWNFITHKAGDNAIKPAGMAALDVLRIEEGLPRYGHEINETIDPITAGLAHLVDLGHEFVGRDAVAQLSQRPPARKRVSLVIGPDRPPLHGATEITDSVFLFDLQDIIPRQGATILDADGAEVGVVTSGTYSPTRRAVIAMGYVAASAASPDAKLHVDFMGQHKGATVLD